MATVNFFSSPINIYTRQQSDLRGQGNTPRSVVSAECYQTERQPLVDSISHEEKNKKQRKSFSAVVVKLNIPLTVGEAGRGQSETVKGYWNVSAVCTGTLNPHKTSLSHSRLITETSPSATC